MMTQRNFPNKCPRVIRRIECPECHYPYSEAMYSLEDYPDVPHEGPVLKPIHYGDKLYWCKGCQTTIRSKSGGQG